MRKKNIMFNITYLTVQAIYTYFSISDIYIQGDMKFNYQISLGVPYIYIDL